VVYVRDPGRAAICTAVRFRIVQAFVMNFVVNVKKLCFIERSSLHFVLCILL
jgi:hypothetical protein